MFSVKQKRDIAEAVQRILRDTTHPELPRGEIQFSLHVDGTESWSWADIRNNGAITNPGMNPWNERQYAATPGSGLVERARGWKESDLRKFPTATLELIDSLATALALLQGAKGA